MSHEKTHITIGGGTMFPLFIVFLVLKLTGTVDWSWIWVTAPLWVPLALVLAFLGVIFAGPLLVLLMAGLWIAAIEVWDWCATKWKYRNWPAPREKRF